MIWWLIGIFSAALLVGDGFRLAVAAGGAMVLIGLLDLQEGDG